MGSIVLVVSLQIPIVQLDPKLPLPAYAHEGDAGLDLYAREDVTLTAAGGRGLVPTGISIAIPAGLRRIRTSPQWAWPSNMASAWSMPRPDRRGNTGAR